MFSNSVVTNKLKFKDGIIALLAVPLMLVLLPVTFMVLTSMALCTFAIAKLYHAKLKTQPSSNVVLHAVKGKDYTVTQ